MNYEACIIEKVRDGMSPEDATIACEYLKSNIGEKLASPYRPQKTKDRKDMEA